MSAEETSRAARRPLSVSRLAAQMLDPSEWEYLEALKAAGRLGELDDTELLRVASEATEQDPEGRRVELLQLYYDAAGDSEVARRRRVADRFFLQRMGEPATANGLVARLAALAPELGVVELERIGGADGPLVLRNGEAFAAVLDDYEEETDTGELDLAEAQAAKQGVAMVTVRGLVRAINVLLQKRSVKERFVPLRSDLEREVYLGAGQGAALTLIEQDHLEEEHAEGLNELAAW